MFHPGKVIAYPTETVYGLGCDPRDVKAVKRIFAIKGRPEHKPLLLIAGSLAQVRAVADVDKLAPAARKTFRVLASAYWPGPLTLVLPARRGIGLSKLVIPQGEVAIRLTSSPSASKLARRHGFPIVSTSANLAGEPECRSVRAIERAFPATGLTPDRIVDGGALPRRKPSTVVRIRPDGSLETLRQGSVRPTLSA